MKNQITITRTGDHYILSVDGGNIECGTWGDVLTIIESEGKMPLAKFHAETFAKMKRLEKRLELLRNDYDVLYEEKEALRTENKKLRAAIVAWFLRAFKEG
jgi:hypothetical protein